jgi:pimeloyl-ACP methyl ester carboxylesterase
VVLLHGSDGFLQDYTSTIFDRIAAEFETIALDRPGHGYSEIPYGERASSPVQARILHEALAQLGIERPILVGHSWSGLLLLTYAWKYPADVGGLVVLAPWIYRGRFGEPLLRVVSQPWIARLLFPLFALVKPFVVRWFLRDAFASEAVPAPYRDQAEALWLRTPDQLAATARENSGNRRALSGFSPSAISPRIPVLIARCRTPTSS